MKRMSTVGADSETFHKINVIRSVDTELDLKFPADFKTKKVILDPDFSFAKLSELISQNCRIGSIEVSDAATGELVSLETKLIDFLSKREYQKVNIKTEIGFNYSISSRQSSFGEVLQRIGGVQSQLTEIKKGLRAQGINENAAELLSPYFIKIREALSSDKNVDLNDFKKSLAVINDSFLTSNSTAHVEHYLVKHEARLRFVLKDLLEQQERLLKPVQKKENRLVFLVLLAITVQWSFFFYTIYMVDWLGWDIMEPITYSVEVAVMITAMALFFRYRQEISLKGIRSIINTNFLMKNPYERVRLESIEAQIKRVRQNLKMIEVFNEIKS